MTTRYRIIGNHLFRFVYMMYNKSKNTGYENLTHNIHIVYCVLLVVVGSTCPNTTNSTATSTLQQ